MATKGTAYLARDDKSECTWHDGEGTWRLSLAGGLTTLRSLAKVPRTWPLARLTIPLSGFSKHLERLLERYFKGHKQLLSAFLVHGPACHCGRSCMLHLFPPPLPRPGLPLWLVPPSSCPLTTTFFYTPHTARLVIVAGPACICEVAPAHVSLCMPPFAFGSSWRGVHQFQVDQLCHQRSQHGEFTFQRGCNATAVYITQ